MHSGSRTPMYGSQTPIHDGSRTPHYGGMTPHYEPGYTTPGRASAWDPGNPNTPSRPGDFDDMSYLDDPNLSIPFTPQTPGTSYSPYQGHPSPSPLGATGGWIVTVAWVEHLVCTSLSCFKMDAFSFFSSKSWKLWPWFCGVPGNPKSHAPWFYDPWSIHGSCHTRTWLRIQCPRLGNCWHSG